MQNMGRRLYQAMILDCAGKPLTSRFPRGKPQSITPPLLPARKQQGLGGGTMQMRHPVGSTKRGRAKHLVMLSASVCIHRNKDRLGRRLLGRRGGCRLGGEAWGPRLLSTFTWICLTCLWADASASCHKRFRGIPGLRMLTVKSSARLWELVCSSCVEKHITRSFITAQTESMTVVMIEN